MSPRPLRYHVSRFPPELIDEFELDFDSDSLRVQVTEAEDSAVEDVSKYHYTIHRENRLGNPMEFSHHFYVVRKYGVEYVLLGFTFSANTHPTIPRLLLEDTYQVVSDYQEFELDFDSTNLYEIIHPESSALNVTHFGPPINNELWDEAEERSMSCHQTMEEILTDLREEVVEEKVPITAIDGLETDDISSFGYHSPALFVPSKGDEDGRLSPLQALSLVEFIEKFR